MSDIFVFGSNRSGIHGAGAAKYAHRNHGAIMGIGEGLMGDSYAIPTKDDPNTTLSLSEIAQHVAIFLEHARSHPELTYRVTRIGCGYAGYKDQDIWPLFKGYDAANITLPYVWARALNPQLPARLIVAGSRHYQDQRMIDYYLDRIIESAGILSGLEIISGGARGADTAAIYYARKRNIEHCVYLPDWERNGKRAGMMRNRDMAGVSSHLLAFWDMKSPGTDNMIQLANIYALESYVVIVPGEHPEDFNSSNF